MPQLPDSIRNAAAAFDTLPGVGPRAALRYAYWLVTQPKEAIGRFARSVQGLAEGLTICTECGQWSDRSVCAICTNTERNTSVLCVVATSPDVQSIEDTGAFKGRYHVLGGTLDPIEGRTPDTLSIQKLLKRIQASSDRVTEVILALNTDVPGDVTALYLKQQLEPLQLKVTRLARGLPTGAALEYADSMTLANAVKNRRES